MSGSAILFLVILTVTIWLIGGIACLISRWCGIKAEPMKYIRTITVVWAFFFAVGVYSAIEVDRKEAKRREQVKYMTRLIVHGRSPASWDAWDHFEVGKIHWEKGLHEEAHEHFRRAIALSPRYQKSVDKFTSMPRESRKGDPRGLVYPPKTWSLTKGE